MRYLINKQSSRATGQEFFRSPIAFGFNIFQEFVFKLDILSGNEMGSGEINGIAYLYL